VEKTFRKELIDLLSSAGKPLTAPQIKRLLGLPPETRDSEIYAALEHAAKTARTWGLRVVMIPPRCKRCGYVFRTAKPKKPSRCPRCRSEQIEPPAFTIIEE